jgi:hypothetical protein
MTKNQRANDAVEPLALVVGIEKLAPDHPA